MAELSGMLSAAWIWMREAIASPPQCAAMPARTAEATPSSMPYGVSALTLSARAISLATNAVTVAASGELASSTRAGSRSRANR